MKDENCRNIPSPHSARIQLSAIQSIAILLLAGGICQAEEAESAIEELFLNEVAYTQERGEYQLTLGVDFFEEDAFERSELSMELEFGLTDRLQVSIGAPYSLHDDAPGSTREFTEVEIGAALRLIETGSQVLSFSVEAGIPTGDAEPGEDSDTEWEPSLTYGAALSGIELHAGLGAEIEDGDTEFNYYAALVVPGNTISTIIESSVDDDTSYIVPGLQLAFDDDRVVGMGVPIGVGRSADDWGFVLNAVWEF